MRWWIRFGGHFLQFRAENDTTIREFVAFGLVEVEQLPQSTLRMFTESRSGSGWPAGSFRELHRRTGDPMRPHRRKHIPNFTLRMFRHFLEVPDKRARDA